jgi:pilus assembly protein Flp/PilA
MMKLLKRLRKDESGATAIEYGLIAALLSVAIIGGATMIGEELDSTFNSIGGSLQGAGDAADNYGGGGGEGE